MKIAEYNEMMAYLTRPEPEVLPQPKPQELLDIQEDNRKGRLLESLNKIGGRLEDSSLDFIKRENFAVKGFTDEQLIDLGFDKTNIKPQKETYKKLAEIFQQTDIDDELEYLLEKSKNNPKGKIESTLRNVLQKLPEDEKGLKYIANLLGEDVEFVLDMIDNKKILAASGRDEKRLAKNLEKSERLRKEFGKVENWMLKNASKYSDPDKFKKATVNRFGKKNAAIKAMTSSGGNFFSTEFNNSILGYKGTADFAKINKNIGDNIFRTTIYNFNPNVRKAITNEFKSILSGGPAEVQAEARKKIKQSKLFKQFGLTKEIRGPISRLIYKEVGEELYKNLQTFRNPRIGTTDFIRYLEGVVDPKYKGQFKQARIAMEAAGKNQFKKAKEILGISDKIMFDHKIPSSFIKAGYADEIEYIKTTPTTENFNVKIKNKQYDVPVKKLLNRFEKASTPEAKEVIYDLILEKHNNFSKKYGGYLDNVKPSFTDGKIKFSSDASPVSKKTDFIKEFTKAGVQTGELDQKEVKKLIASIACSGKAMGGRIGFQDGTSCFEKGKKMINTGNIPEGAAKKNFINFANKAMEIGKQSGRGLRTITKFGVLPEMVIIGADTLIRTGMGDRFDEAFLRASDIYRTDDAYEQADASEINRRMNSNDGELILNLRKFNNERAKLSSLEQQKEADLTLAGDDFAETNSGMTEDEIEKFYAPKIQEQENNLFNASISDAEERAGLAKETEFADKKGVDYKKSIVGGFLDTLAEKPGLKQVADLFNTGTVQQPDVSAQAIDNYAPDAFKKTLQKYGPKVTLDAIKRFEAEKEYPEGAVRNKNLQDEERRLLFEAAKNDPALAELYFGPSMTFAGDPIDQTDLQDEMNLDRGIYSQGGRIGYGVGGITRVYQLLRGVNKTKPLKGLVEKLIKQYKSEGMEFIEAIKKAQTEAAGIRYESKMKIIDDAMKNTNVYSDDYVNLLDMKIKLEDPDFAKDYMNFSETLKNKTRARTDEGWAEANFGENYSEQMDIARSKEINESIDPNFKEPLSPSDQMASDIDDMNKANIDDYFGTRKKQTSGGLTRIGYSNGSEGTALAIEESLEAFQRYLKAGGKLGYKDFIALGNEGVSKFFNSGGRVGFADGPKNPGRRTFMKLAAGIASIPLFGKFFKPAVPLVKKLANSSTVMPDWFPNFVDKFVGRSIGKKIDADLMEYTNPDLPNIKLTRKDDGSILVEGRNEFNEAYNISYEPPGYELIDEKTGKAVKTKGEFEAVEGRHVALGPEDYDTDAFYADDLDELFTNDIADMEKYTTGNVTKTVKDAFGTETGLKKGKYDVDMAQGKAENQADILADEGLDEID